MALRLQDADDRMDCVAAGRTGVDGRFSLRMGPLRSVIAARVFDAANNAHSIDAATFIVDAAANIIASPCWALRATSTPHFRLSFALEPVG